MKLDDLIVETCEEYIAGAATVEDLIAALALVLEQDPILWYHADMLRERAILAGYQSRPETLIEKLNHERILRRVAAVEQGNRL